MESTKSAPSSSLSINVATNPSLLAEPAGPREQGITLFNESAKKGLEMLFASGIIKPTPRDVALFFRSTPTLDQAKLGDYLGQRDPFNQDVLKDFLGTFDFQSMDFDVALRNFLACFRLPGESQVIERIVENFAKQFCCNNPEYGFIASSEAAFILSYSIIMLATDLHNPNVKTKMTKDQWIKNNAGCNNKNDFDINWLKKIYERISKTPLSTIGSQSPSMSSTNRSKGGLQKAASAQHISLGQTERTESKYGFPLLKRNTTKATM